ncbi:unnamed protein product [Phytophthora fragariaefolia]|uniref:Unnamed protein product n=1 Tax=Phytophthora fragariaefolia TaxID=1490495 RepID=A0A9W6WTD1_9STRA|nr:unnamed protein product [Phytophthora fragariaefolia]
MERAGATAAAQQKTVVSVTLQAGDGTRRPWQRNHGATRRWRGVGRRSGSAGEIGGKHPFGSDATMRNGDGTQRDNDHNGSTIDSTARDCSGPGSASAGPPPMQAPGSPAANYASGTETVPPFVVREKVKALKLTKFKGLDDAMPVSMWLKTVRAERGEIGADWHVSAFLKVMSSTAGATHVRGHHPKTLDEALNVAIPQVEAYGEGYGIGLEASMSAWDAREAARGRGPLATVRSAAGGHEKSAVGSNSRSVVTGYNPGWSAAPKPPRTRNRSRCNNTKEPSLGARVTQALNAVNGRGNSGGPQGPTAPTRGRLLTGDGAAGHKPAGSSTATEEYPMMPSDGAGAISKDKRVHFADTNIGHTGNSGERSGGDHVGDNVPDGDGSYGGEDNRRQRLVVDTAYTNNPKSREELVRVVNKQLEAWVKRFRTDEGHHETHQEEYRRASIARESPDGSPRSVKVMLAEEVHQRDPAKALAIRVKADEIQSRARLAEEETQQLQRRQKRKERERARRDRIAQRDRTIHRPPGGEVTATVPVGLGKSYTYALTDKGEKSAEINEALATAKTDRELIRLSRTRRSDDGARPARVGRLRAVQEPTVESLPTAQVRVGGEWRDIKLNTGAQFCVAGESWKGHGERLGTFPPVDFVEGFTGAVAKVEGVWRFRFKTQYGQAMVVDALVVEGAAEEYILGEDWMMQNGVKIDFTSSEMKWCQEDRAVFVHEERRECGTSGARPVSTEAAAPTLTRVSGGKIVVPVMNFVGRTAQLPAQEKIGTWSPTSEDMIVMEVTSEFDKERVQRWLQEVKHGGDTPLSNENELAIGEMGAADKQLLLKLLRSYPTLLEPQEGCPPQTTLGVSHEIHTGAEPPIKVRARRHSHTEQAIIDEQIDKMLADGVIEKASGAWGFPVVLVRKKDGSVRFCIDYRPLNAVTKKDVYLLPRIDDTLDNLHGARRFTSLDLHAGYWQVPVAEKDRDKTGFITRKGLFRFVRMTFGLANGPGTFQRMMDAVLRGLTWQSCLVYLDDVIVFSQGSVAQHVLQLAAVLERLSSAGLSLKARFTTKSASLTKLLRKGVVWCWGDSQEAAFECLKRALTDRPLLAYPGFSKPFRLVTDASQVGLAAALTQDKGQGEQPIAYASRINSPTVAKYSITELECAAVVWAVKLFRPYLYGRKFVLVTDHAALKWLMTSKELTGRLHRWALQLQEYDFDIIYRSGASNVVADALSRAPIQAVLVSGSGTTTTNGGQRDDGSEGQLSDQMIKAEQARDRTVQNLIRKGKYHNRRIVVEDDVAYIIMSDGSKRVVLPTSLWTAALKESHDSIYAGHLRTPQTCVRIGRNYWWPDMRSHVRRWVQACRDCGTRKGKPREVIPPLRSQGVGTPGDRWAPDVTGPLPVTSGENRYVIAAVDYATRYAVAVAVPRHTAQDIAHFIMDKLVLVYGPIRELVLDGAPELSDRVVEALTDLVQAKQISPVPYSPALLGLVERFHRSWKGIVAIFVEEAQNDWDRWLPCAVNAYNGARHSAIGFSPNELMMGRQLRAPNELLRTMGVTQIGEFTEYHRGLVRHMARSAEIAKATLAKDQQRRANGATTRPITDCEARMSGRRLTAGVPEGTAATQARNDKPDQATGREEPGIAARKGPERAEQPLKKKRRRQELAERAAAEGEGGQRAARSRGDTDAARDTRASSRRALRQLQESAAATQSGTEGYRRRAARTTDLQHEVEVSALPGLPTRWISGTQFEALLDAHNIGDDLGAGGGV